MAHPKRRQSSSRRDKRRTHDKVALPTLSICSATGLSHLRHRGYWHEGKFYYKGKIVIDIEETSEL